LNALKAYSLGERAYNNADLKSAETYFNEALRIDPHFALARIGLAKIFDGEDQPANALQQIRAAQADRSRLSARDALYVDAWAASYTEPAKSLEKWKLLASVYPDYFPGIGTYAYFLSQFGNRFSEAIPYLEQSASPKNPHRATSEYLLGAFYVEAGRYADAIRAFSRSVSDGAHFQNALYASAYAAQRKFKLATEVLERGKPSGARSFDIINSSTTIAIALDQGNWTEADKLLATTRSRAESLGPRVMGRYAGMALSLQALNGTSTAVQIAAIKDYLAKEKKALAQADKVDQSELKFQIVLAAYLAARAGNAELAEQALAAAGPKSDADTSVSENLRVVARAELLRASGKPQEALAMLKAMVNGSELYITHVALIDAYADIHDNKGALGEARWLSSHRGRAYVESNMLFTLTPFNVVESDLALLRTAELAYASGNAAEAQHALNEFQNAWPAAARLPWVMQRINKLHH